MFRHYYVGRVVVGIVVNSVSKAAVTLSKSAFSTCWVTLSISIKVSAADLIVPDVVEPDGLTPARGVCSVALSFMMV
jgi:hypothetical protein